MPASIPASGLAAVAICALVGVTYNTMFSTSRVMSFTAGQLAMLGGVFGSMFTLKIGMPLLAGFVLTLIACAIIGIVTEFVAVRPVLKNLDQHLYVLSTLALASNISIAARWSARPFWRSRKIISRRGRLACPSAICVSQAMRWPASSAG